jgi:urease accessory protein
MSMNRLAIVFICLVVADPAHAHVGQGVGYTLASGVAHPFSGLDHVAAMLSVGLWAALAGGRRLWVWPLAFIAAMLVGGFLGGSGIALPAVEPAIACSVAILGLLVASGTQVRISAGAALIALFAVFHGHAHGAEAPVQGWASYAAGFALATAALHLVGVGLGCVLERGTGRLPVRAIGAATAVLGVFILLR